MDLEDSLGYLIARAHKSLKRNFMAIMGTRGLTGRQFAVLHLLSDRDGQSAQDLVEKMFSDSSTVVAVIDRLEEKGLVERRDDPNDRRVNRIHLTRKARKILPGLLRKMDDLERERQSLLTAEEIRTLKAALGKLHRMAWRREEQQAGLTVRARKGSKPAPHGS